MQSGTWKSKRSKTKAPKKSIFGAFVLSRRLVSPIQNLVEGTKAVAKGDFDMRLPVPGKDEIGFLTNSTFRILKKLSRLISLITRC